MKDKNERDIVIKRLENMLQGAGQYVRDDDTLTPEQQLVQVDVILDTMKFLQDYEENVKVLNKYWLEKRWKQKFEKALGRDKED